MESQGRGATREEDARQTDERTRHSTTLSSFHSLDISRRTNTHAGTFKVYTEGPLELRLKEPHRAK